MDVNNIVTVTIFAQANSATRKSFGIPAVLAYHTHNTDRIRQYSQLSDMVADGFSTTEAAYLMATAIKSQTPCPPIFKVIRGTTSHQQIFVVTVTDHTEGHKVGLSMLDSGGTLRDMYYTVLNTDTTNSLVATGLGAVIGAVPGVAGVVVSTNTITVTITTAGNTWYPSLIPGNAANFSGGFQYVNFADNTADCDTDVDLTAALNVDKQWYGFSTQYIDGGGSGNIQDASEWAEANKRIHAYVTADTANLTGGSGIGNTLKTAAYKYSFGAYSQTPGGFSALAVMANRFTLDPGTEMWDLSDAIGAIPDDNLSGTQLTALATNNLNVYTTTEGLVGMTSGQSANGQFMDLTRFLDALNNRIQIDQYESLKAANAIGKVPFTAKGLSKQRGVLQGSLDAFLITETSPMNALSNDVGFEPKATVPLIQNVPLSDKKARVLKKLNFTATYASPIQTVQIQGIVNF